MSPVQTRAGATSGEAVNGAQKHSLDSTDGRPEKASKPNKKSKKQATKGRLDQKNTSVTKATKAKAQRKSLETSAPLVVETGILNYFIRGRVEIDDPKNLDEVARGYLIMRPVPDDTHLTKRPLPDGLTARLVALPKKQLPQATRDRFMAFVDETDMPYSKLAEGFLAPREYATKTVGTRHVPIPTPVGEGVYAIIQSESETHLAYISTLPEDKSEFQHELGFRDRGSFIISTKNPKFGGPAYAQLPTPPDYPQKILDGFGSYRWIPTKPEHLNCKNTQLLLIGHGENNHLISGEEQDQEKVEQKLEELEDDDFKGMRNLAKHESEAIFADLQAKSKWFHDFPEVFETA